MPKLKKIFRFVVPLAFCTVILTIVKPVSFIRAATTERFGTYIPAAPDDIIVTVTAQTLNVRSGPGTGFSKIASVNKDDKLVVLGALDGWFVVHLPNNSVGVINSQYVTANEENILMLVELTENINIGKEMVMDENAVENVFNTRDSVDKHTNGNTNSAKSITEPKLTQIEFGKWSVQNFSNNNKKEVDVLLSLINEERAKNSIAPLRQDNILTNIAYFKSAEMSAKQYFSHDSPTYGSPFEMLKHFGITYKKAAENIVGNKNIYSAHEQVMASPNHKVNVLNENFTKIGIGISDDKRYGNVIVMMFVE